MGADSARTTLGWEIIRGGLIEGGGDNSKVGAYSRTNGILSKYFRILKTEERKKYTYLLKTSGPFMTMQWAPVSFATAFASNVFPVPGGP